MYLGYCLRSPPVPGISSLFLFSTSGFQAQATSYIITYLVLLCTLVWPPVDHLMVSEHTQAHLEHGTHIMPFYGAFTGDPCTPLANVSEFFILLPTFSAVLAYYFLSHSKPIHIHVDPSVFYDHQYCLQFCQ